MATYLIDTRGKSIDRLSNGIADSCNCHKLQYAYKT